MTPISQHLSACVLIPDFRGGEMYVLAVTRKDDPNRWGLPGGKVDAGESHVIAAVRELREETGVVVMTTMLTPVYTALDIKGWICTTFLASACYVFRGDKPCPLAREHGLEPEPNTKVAWLKARTLTDPQVSPFHGYFTGLFKTMAMKGLTSE